MSSLKQIVKWFVIIIFLITAASDVIFAALGFTISEYMRNLAGVDHLWFVPYFASVIIGHWWINIWTADSRWLKEYVVHRYVSLVVMGVLAIIFNLTILKTNIPWYFTVPGGLLTGAILWPQAKKNSKS